ncbi:MAG: beta-galactosidase, partial [Bacteroidales bacterium]|nr:beta-galactosidase [Bacteroidales bacterium]
MRNSILYSLLIVATALSGCESKTGKTTYSSSPLEVAANGLQSEVRILNGVPALYVNGELTGQTLAAPYRPDESYFRDFLNAGIKIYDIYLRFDWTGPEEYDFKKIDDKLDSYLAIEPEALFLPRILLTPGPWWCEQFPNDITMRDDGTPAGMFGQPCHPSLASEKYRELSYKAMVAFLTHVEGKYGKNILGYQPGNGFGGEWLMFNSFWEARPGRPGPEKFGVEDYSPVAQEAFKIWLKKRYKNESALRKAWNDSEVTFETATPPGEVERYSSNYGIFFDPARGRRVTDYFSFFNDITCDVLLENCRWVKELTGGRKIVGVFYGYLWCNFPNLSVNHTGHLGLQRVLDSDDVDFLASPYTYDNKQIGGPNNSQTLPENALMHGKLYLNEVDTETHLFQRQWRWGDCLNNPTSWEETKALLIRDYGYSMTKGFGLWWTDLHGGNFQDSSIIDLLGKLKKIDDDYLNEDKTSNAEIAVILDEETFKYFGDGEPLFNALLTAQKQWQLAFVGAPWEPCLLTDIGNPSMKDFKVYMFLNTFHVTPKQKKEIHKKLSSNGATAIWVYAPGFI